MCIDRCADSCRRRHLLLLLGERHIRHQTVRAHDQNASVCGVGYASHDAERFAAHQTMCAMLSTRQ
jgi:hypothetical protein